MPSKRKFSDYRNCSVCGVKVKIQNLEKHFRKVHPKFINELSWIDTRNRCLVCGEEGVNTFLGVCNDHLVKIIPKFLVKNVFFPLRERVAERLRKQENECVEYFLVQVPMFIYATFGAEPEKKPPEAFLSFSSMATFLGYSLARICEIFDGAGETAYDLALRESAGGLWRTRYDAPFLDALLSEFEFFQAALFGTQGFYHIAVDSSDTPSKLFIIPRTDTETVRKMLLLRISDAESMWRASFARLLRPSTQQCVLDEMGAFFCFPRKEIYKHFDIFAKAWSETFPSCPVPIAEEFSALSDLFKWVACPFGFTKTNPSKAYNLSEFPNFGLSEDRLFSFLDCLLADVKSNLNVISHRSLSDKESFFRTNEKLMRIAWGFSFSSSRGRSYFLPVREWFYNKIMPILVRIGRSLDVAGDFFEEETRVILKLLSGDNIRLKYSPSFGMVPVLKTKRPSKSKVKMNWRILEKNFPISIKNPRISKIVGEKGEIDLIVYANFSIYLLELKSLNLTVDRARKHIKEVAPKQCAKYAAWARQREEFLSLLEKHGISEDDVKSVRIICCTNGIFDDTEIVCSETGERFAIVPQFIVFSLFVGSVTVSMKDVFPELVLRLRNGLLIAIPSIKNLGLIDCRKQISQTANALLTRWLSLMIYDRRRDYKEISFKEARPLDLARFLVFREVHVGNTYKWFLKQPVLIESVGEWKYYVGTQIASAGSTLVCPNCKSVVKYYYTENEQDNNVVEQALKKKICPFCKHKMASASEFKEITSEMTMIMAKHKYELDHLMLENHLS